MTDAQSPRREGAISHLPHVPHLQSHRQVPQPAPQPPGPGAGGQDAVVPVGYRQGCITAISVLLAFSLAFWRYWSFEAPGQWTPVSMLVEIAIVLAAALQAVALFRSLRVEDDRVPEYHRTQRWLLASGLVLIAALGGALVDDVIYG